MSHSNSQLPEARRAYIDLLRFCSNTNNGQDAAVESAIHALIDSPQAISSLLPLLYQKLQSTGLFSRFSDDVQQSIRHTALILTAREAANKRWLLHARQSFEAQGIPVILLKGAAFAGYLYDTEVPRPGVDIDLLVREKDFDAACAVMEDSADPVILSESRLATHSSLFERVFRPRNQASCTVELHRGLTNPYIFTIDENSLWENSEPHPAYDHASTRVLAPEHTLLHMAVHGFRDLEFCSHSLLDAHRLFLIRNINEDRLFEMANAWGAKAVLYQFLVNLRDTMETDIQPGLLDRLEPSRIARLSQHRMLEQRALQAGEASAHRLTQLVSQLVFPDRITSALKFHAHYFATRFRDLLSR